MRLGVGAHSVAEVCPSSMSNVGRLHLIDHCGRAWNVLSTGIDVEVEYMLHLREPIDEFG